MFVGNSITLRVPKPEFGWFGNWGMAASSAEKDYVHLLMDKIRAVSPDVLYQTLIIADFERSFQDYDMREFKTARDFEPDLIVMRIGENVADERAGAHALHARYLQLIDFLNPAGTARVICSTCFWDKPSVNEEITRAARSRDYELVDLMPLSLEEHNMARDQFWHAGVGAHPSDRGMALIAQMLWDAVRQKEIPKPI